MDLKRLLLVGGLGVVAVIGYMQLKKMSAPAPTKRVKAPIAKVVSTVEYVDILMASRDIPMGTRLNPEMIEWHKWPTEALNENLIDNTTHPQAMEKFTKAVTRTYIYAGEPILNRKVVHSGERGQMAALLKPGMRGISTRINVESAAGGFIQPGDRVDVILTTNMENTLVGMQNNGAPKNYFSRTIFENVKVLAIGKASTSATGGAAYVSGSTALLELSQADAEVLIEAQSKGDLSLTLRGLNRRKAAFVPSAATTARKETNTVSSVTLYRSGQSQQVSIQGQ